MKTPEQLKGAIRNIANKKNLRAQEIMQMFLFERILERLANSQYKSNFILKGGLLISSMIKEAERTTMDMDTTVRGIQMTEEEIIKAVKNVLSIDAGDGISFTVEKIEPIHEVGEYSNFRIYLRAKYGKIDSPMKIDITTGDVITPAAIQYNYPLIFEDRTISIMAYTIETIIAEKFETILKRNIETTRARDYFDLYTLYRENKERINLEVLRLAVINTAEKRGSIKEIEDWRDILNEIKEEDYLQRLWDNYVSNTPYIGELSFKKVLTAVEEIATVLDI